MQVCQLDVMPAGKARRDPHACLSLAELKVADFGVSKVLDKKTKRLQDL